MYRDLKPENVVLDGSFHAMLTDFGLSKEAVAQCDTTHSFLGSLAFLAPEVVQRQGHGHTVDIYNLGVLLFHMLTGMPPYYHADRETLFRNIKHQALQVPCYVSSQAKALITVLLKRDPSQRLGAQNTAIIQTHPFFGTLTSKSYIYDEFPCRLVHDIACMPDSSRRQ